MDIAKQYFSIHRNSNINSLFFFPPLHAVLVKDKMQLDGLIHGNLQGPRKETTCNKVYISNPNLFKSDLGNELRSQMENDLYEKMLMLEAKIATIEIKGVGGKIQHFNKIEILNPSAYCLIVHTVWPNIYWMDERVLCHFRLGKA